MIWILAGGLLMIVIFFAGLAAGSALDMRDKLRELGLTKETVKEYHQAAKIMNRLVRITELDGDFAADVLSPESHKMITEWVTRYRQRLEKI